VIDAKEGGYAFDVCATDRYSRGAGGRRDGAVVNGDVQYGVWGSVPERTGPP
jgi:hypothetical protein